jgi:hypothetical protein
MYKLYNYHLCVQSTNKSTSNAVLRTMNTFWILKSHDKLLDSKLFFFKISIQILVRQLFIYFSIFTKLSMLKTNVSLSYNYYEQWPSVMIV